MLKALKRIMFTLLICWTTFTTLIAIGFVAACYGFSPEGWRDFGKAIRYH